MVFKNSNSNYKDNYYHTTNLYKIEYIHGKKEDVRWKYIRLRDPASDTYKNSLFYRYMQNLRQSINFMNVDTKELVDISKLSDETLVSIMNEMAEGMNEIVEGQLGKLNELRGKLLENANFAETKKGLLTKKIDVKNNEFYNMMDSIFQVLQLVTNNSFDAKSWDSFVTIYRKLFNSLSLKSLQNKKMDQLISGWQFRQGATLANKVIELLRRIPTNLINAQTGQVTASVRGSLQYIMREVIESQTNQIVSSMGFEVDKKIREMMIQSSKGKISGGQEKRKRTFSPQEVEYYNNKIVIKSKSFQESEGRYAIQGHLSSKVNWFSPNLRSSESKDFLSSKIQLANKANGLIHLLTSMYEAYGNTKSVRYGIYNTLVWSNSSSEADGRYTQIQRDLVRREMNLSLVGKNLGIYELDSFLLINGEFYSVAGILYAVQQEVDRAMLRGVSNDVVFVNLNTNKAVQANTWLPPEDENKSSAIKRNKIVKSVLNKLGFQVILNGPMLKRQLASNSLFLSSKLTI